MANIEKFDAAADFYDTPERVSTARICAAAVRELLPPDAKSKTALDFGCGTGLVGAELAADFAHVTLVDASGNMLRRARERAAGAGNVSVLLADAEKDGELPLKADCVFAVQVLLHIRDVGACLSSLYRALNANGRLIIIDFFKNREADSPLIHNGFDTDELAAVLRAFGFQSVRARGFYSGKNMLMGKDAELFIICADK